jgi:hypothetical protein
MEVAIPQQLMARKEGQMAEVSLQDMEAARKEEVKILQEAQKYANCQAMTSRSDSACRPSEKILCDRLPSSKY